MSVPNIKRNVEVGTIYIPLWHTGLYTQRSPLFTPISAMGIQIISRFDTLWDGLNMEISLSNTLVRRPGFPAFCSANFGATEPPLAYYSFKNLNGTIVLLVDTLNEIYTFTTSAITSLFPKGAGSVQTSFQKVGNTLYMADGVEFIQWDGGATSTLPVGIAVPVAAPSVATGAGNLLPTSGWTYGYSYGNSVTGAVSTMSPITPTTGNLDETTITETTASCSVDTCVVSGNGSPGFAPGTVLFGTPNGNSFLAGDIVTLTGFSQSFMNTSYVVESSTVSQFTASSGPWGSPGLLNNPTGWTYAVNLSGLTNVTATKSPITIPGSAESYVYTVVNSGSQFLASNLFGGASPAIVKGGTVTRANSHTGTVLTLDTGSQFAQDMYETSTNKCYAYVTAQWAVGSSVAISGISGGAHGGASFTWLNGQTVTVESCSPIATSVAASFGVSGYVVTFTDPTGYGAIHGNQGGFNLNGTFSGNSTITFTTPTTVFTQVATSGDVTGAGLFYCDVNGDFTFYSGDVGRPISIVYEITPTGGAATVSFTVSGQSTNSPAPLQTDTTGFTQCDNITVYRTLDGDATGGPWYFLNQIPNNVALSGATLAGGQTTYTFTNTIPAGANNGFASAPGTKGAYISGFSNSALNGQFSILNSTDTSITCDNATGATVTGASAMVNSAAWYYTDTGSVFGYTLDTSDQDGELNILIEAPIDDENNPPPNTTNPITTSVTGTFSLLCYNAGRLWGAVDNFVYFSGGPDVTYGSPEDSWPPANVFTFPGKVTALVSVNAGLLVFTDSDMYIIYGTSTATFYSNLYQRNFGVANQNCIAQDGDNLFVFTTKSQLFCFTDQLQEIGFNIGDQLLANFPPSQTYLTIHRNGSDAGLFINGPTYGFKYRLDQQSWSTKFSFSSSVPIVASIETSADTYTLLASTIYGGTQILQRDETGTIFQDFSANYPCFATIGSLLLSPPGTVSILESILLDTIPVAGSAGPTVSVLLNEISGTFVTLPNPVNDPPLLPATTSITSSRYYLRAATTPLPQQVKHLMVKIAFSTENYAATIMTLGIG